MADNKKNSQMKEWREFERLVAALMSEEYGEEFTVIPNARVVGYISGIKRQIDVLIEYRFDSNISKRIIIDAKLLTRPVDIKEVESFEGMMKDLQAQHGFIVCKNGYTKAALTRAQEHIGIRLVTSQELEELDLNLWERCEDPKCKKGLVLWDSSPGIIVDGSVTVQMTGKCDECGKFHVWCWGCSRKKALDWEDDWKCGCNGPWFWLTAIESEDEADKDIHKGIYLLVILENGSHEIIDRRPL